MWILVQVLIFMLIVGVAMFCSIGVVWSVVLFLMMASFSLVFAPWLLGVQLLVLLFSGLIGTGIVAERQDKIYRDEEEKKRINKKAYERYKKERKI